MFAADFGTGEVAWSFLWLFLLIIWLVLFINVLGDIMRSHDLSGVAKALWILGLLVFPYLGVLAYFLVRGGSMRDRAIERAQADENAFKGYIQSVAAAPSTGEELERLDGLRQRGVINEAEFASLKADALAAGSN